MVLIFSNSEFSLLEFPTASYLACWADFSYVSANLSSSSSSCKLFFNLSSYSFNAFRLLSSFVKTEGNVGVSISLTGAVSVRSGRSLSKFL